MTSKRKLKSAWITPQTRQALDRIDDVTRHIAQTIVDTGLYIWDDPDTETQTENDLEIHLANESRKLGVRVDTLVRWKKILSQVGVLSNAQIAERQGVSLDTIKRDIRRMKQFGYISK